MPTYAPCMTRPVYVSPHSAMVQQDYVWLRVPCDYVCVCPSARMAYVTVPFPLSPHSAMVQQDYVWLRVTACV